MGEQILKLVKAQLGITITSRDDYIKAIIDGVKRELEEVQGLKVDLDDSSILMFVVDYAAWRYESRNEDAGMPERLNWRLRNLMVSQHAKKL